MQALHLQFLIKNLLYDTPGEWRNLAARARLKTLCPKGRVGSNPTSPTIEPAPGTKIEILGG